MVFVLGDDRMTATSSCPRPARASTFFETIFSVSPRSDRAASSAFPDSSTAFSTTTCPAPIEA